MKMRTVLVLSIVLAQGGALAQDEEVKQKRPADFDTNRDRKLDQAEWEAFHRHRIASEKRDIDTNRDGKISDAEREAYEVTTRQRVQDAVDDYTGELDVSEIERDFPPPAKGSLKTIRELTKVRLRRSIADASLLTQESEASFKMAQSAIFSYRRDFEEESDIWEARGAVAYPLLEATSTAVLASISLDRSEDESDDGSETNSFVPRLSFERLFESQGRSIPSLYFRAAGAYASDFDFDSSVVAAEAELEPVYLPLGIGILRDVPLIRDILEYRVRPVLHFEYGTVLAAGGKQGLESGDTFARLGPQLRFELLPKFDAGRRTSVFVRYDFLADLSSDSDHIEMFEVGGKYELDEAGLVSLEASYRNGEIALVRDSVEIFAVQLGLKF